MFGCQEDDASGNLVSGMVRYLPPPDNCDDYVIRVEDQLYYPTDLAEEFRQDSLIVQLSFTATDRVHNCGFAGTISVIDVLNIKKQ